MIKRTSYKLKRTPFIILVIAFCMHIGSHDLSANELSAVDGKRESKTELTASLASDDLLAPEIILEKYIDTVKKGNDHQITVSVTDNVGVKQVTLFYRTIGIGEYKRMAMVNIVNTDDYHATIKSDQIKAPGVEYYIQAMDNAGNTLLHGYSFAPLSVKMTNGDAATVTSGDPPEVLVSDDEKSSWVFSWLIQIFSGGSSTTNVETKTLPISHVWQPISHNTVNESDYAMYTYVLFGRDPKKLSLKDENTLLQYQFLIEAIVGTTEHADDVLGIPHMQTNVFQIPVRDLDISPSLDNYDIHVSAEILHKIRHEMRVERENEKLSITGKGPFLASTLTPLNKLGEKQKRLLFADLSTVNPSAMKEIVLAYKLRVSTEPVNDIEEFKSIRLRLLSFLLDTDDAVILVKSAVADFVGDK